MLKEIARLALPLALVQLGTATMGLVDTALLGRYSESALAGSGLGGSIIFSIAAVGIGIVFGAEPMISQAIGAKQSDRASLALRQAIWMAVLLTPVLSILMLLALLALPYTGVSSETIPETREFVLGRMAGILPFLTTIACKGYFQATGKMRPIIVSLLLSNIANVGLAYALIFGVPVVGIPAMGTLGAGIATSICSWIGVLSLTAAISEELGLKNRRDTSWQGLVALWKNSFVVADFRKILRIGLPIGLQIALEVAIFSLVAFLMGGLSTQDLAAHQIALNLASFSFNIIIGISSAASVLVGKAIGAGDQVRTKQAGLACIGAAAGFMGFCGVIFLVFPRLLADVFTDNQEVAIRAVTLLQIAGAFQIFDGVQGTASGALRGAGDTRWSFVIHLASHWGVGFPLALLLAFPVGLGAAGLWWGLTGGLAFAALCLTWRFMLGARKGYQSLVHDEQIAVGAH